MAERKATAEPPAPPEAVRRRRVRKRKRQESYASDAESTGKAEVSLLEMVAEAQRELGAARSSGDLTRLKQASEVIVNLSAALRAQNEAHAAAMNSMRPSKRGCAAHGRLGDLAWGPVPNGDLFLGSLLAEMMPISELDQEMMEGMSEHDVKAARDSGVQALPLKGWPMFGSSAEGMLLVRKEMRSLWSAALKFIVSNGSTEDSRSGRYLDDPLRIEVTGNPGIGKSRTLTYFLRLVLCHMLARPEDEIDIVLYEARALGTVYAFVLDKDAPHGFRLLSALLDTRRQLRQCPAVFLDSTVLLVDPANPATPPLDCKAATVLAASPNKAHTDKWHCAHRLLASPWTGAELMAVVPVLRPAMTKAELQRRYSRVGGAIRYIVHPDAFERRCAKILSDAAGLDRRTLETAFAGNVYALPDNVPSSLFTFRRYIEGPELSHEARYFHLDFASLGAMVAVAAEAGETLTRSIATAKNCESTLVGALFEHLALLVAANSSDLPMWHLTDQGRGPELAWTSARKIVRSHGTEASDLERWMKLPPNELLVPASSRFPVADALAVGSDGRLLAVQATVAERHPISARGLETILGHAAARAGVTAKTKPRKRLKMMRKVKNRVQLVHFVPWYRADNPQCYQTPEPVNDNESKVEIDLVDQFVVRVNPTTVVDALKSLHKVGDITALSTF